MLLLREIIANEFEPHVRHDGEVSISGALDEIDQCHVSLAQMLVMARETLLYGDARERERLTSHLHATLALLAMVAPALDTVNQEVRRLRQIEGQRSSQPSAAKPARQRNVKLGGL